MLPFLKARTNIEVDALIIFGIAGSFLWPISITLILGWFILIVPGIFVFKKSEDFFKIKEIPPMPPKEIDAAKSSYRTVNYTKPPVV